MLKDRQAQRQKLVLLSYKAQFVFDVTSIIEMEELPPDLFINWDHMGIHYVPVSNWTLAGKGSKRVEIARVDDKWLFLHVREMQIFSFHKLSMQESPRDGRFS